MFVSCVQSRRLRRFGTLIVCGLLVAGCSSFQSSKKVTESDYSPRVVKKGQPVPEGGGAFKIGRAYTIKGKTYKPRHQPDYDEVGVASWYGADFHGRKTANGEVYNMNALTAAHKTLPLPTYVRVTNLENDKSIVVRVNDRGPFSRGRIIDLSRKTAEILDFKHNGTAKVRVQYVGRAPLDGQDEWLTTTVRDNGTNKRVAKVDQALAAQAFASDGDRKVAKKRYRTASSAYSKKRGLNPFRRDKESPEIRPREQISAGNFQVGAFSVRQNAERLADQLRPYGEVSMRTDETGLHIVSLLPNDPAFDPSIVTGEEAVAISSIY